MMVRGCMNTKPLEELIAFISVKQCQVEAEICGLTCTATKCNGKKMPL